MTTDQQLTDLLQTISERVRQIDPNAKFDLNIETTESILVSVDLEPFCTKPLMCKMDAKNGTLWLSDINQLPF